ncbi:hypothetical protein JQ582_37200 [Bradyrhizobium japonicum]|uniref:hypothetical protein n=1 Tax=Bradyrhizobium TaxID=374 RepID=UPI001BA667A7|nr:hypothetical protein [Bradyrhizobium japonicum]MBR0734839.1 hypothetical protein [Bradyrhizobium japonicum]MBR0749573.1 hypothetical protein [Bradyrhizobium japonicum]MBR0808436.1 hypothetical protein [Bradyrhizobium japonicum]MCD9824482.1 hypothetical protein [Bradyrhizobium japonicum]MCD9897623.1 hypothetical protein [Bradyrhizobium japonicum]
MSDLDPHNVTQFAKNQNKGPAKDLKEQIGDAGAEVKQRTGDAFQASADLAQEKFGEAADAAKGVAEGTVDQIQSQAREQQRSGADFIERLAGNIRDAGRAFETDVPFAARGIDSAADYVEDAAQKIREGSFRDLVEGATDFAKRQPAAFLGISVLAGFAAVRFLKASGGQSSSAGQRETKGRSSSGSSQKTGGTSFSAGGQARAPESVRRDPNTQQNPTSQGSTVP